jgi:hypothetical protein
MPWSVLRWLPATPATSGAVPHGTAFAVDVATFPSLCGQVDVTGGAAPGLHNFHRGAPVSVHGDVAAGIGWCATAGWWQSSTSARPPEPRSSSSASPIGIRDQRGPRSDSRDHGDRLDRANAQVRSWAR